MKYFIAIFIFLFAMCTFAQQSGGSGDDLENVCQLAGGEWRTSTNGWACCWADWGCYGCVNSVCQMKCHTERCRKANGQTSRPTSNQQAVDALAPKGMKAPIVPKPPKAQQNNPSTSTIQ